jgi:hypothetical protein
VSNAKVEIFASTINIDQSAWIVEDHKFVCIKRTNIHALHAMGRGYANIRNNVMGVPFVIDANFAVLRIQNTIKNQENI